MIEEFFYYYYQGVVLTVFRIGGGQAVMGWERVWIGYEISVGNDNHLLLHMTCLRLHLEF
jgi:hypothetical protein